MEKIGIKLFPAVKKTGFYKKRGQHDCFYTLLLPIPDRHNDLVSDITSGKFSSFIEIENLLPSETLKSNDLVTEETILTVSYLKVKNKVKTSISKILITLDKSEFDDFIPLYEKIEMLFEI